MKKYICTRIMVCKEHGDVEVMLAKYKVEEKWSFVNLTKGHICPCKFDSYIDAIADLENCKRRGEIKDWEFID